MICFPVRRAYLPVLLGVIALLLILQFRTRPDGRIESSPPAGSSAPLTKKNSARPDPNVIANFEEWRTRFAETPENHREALLEEGRSLAETRRDTFLALMRSDPAAALAHALPLEEVAALPPELKPFFEQPVNGIGSIDLLWRTNLNDDGSLSCQHEHVLHLDGNSWNVVSSDPFPPRRDVPVSGIALDDLAVLAPSAVRVLAPDELESARDLFPAGNPNGLDPVTGGAASARASALVGGRIFQFESSSIVEHVADALLAAEEEAREQNRHAIEHGFEWLAASGGGGDEGEPPVDESPFMDDTIDVLFIRLDFSDFPGAPVSQLDLETTLNAVKGNIQDYSYNAATIIPTVTPLVYRMPNTGASYAVAGDNSGIQADARTLASADFTIANYDVIGVFFPSLSGVPGSNITYTGLGSIGGSNQWINGVNSTNTILHEFGHNYGAYHANYWDITQTLPGEYDVPFSREYGDIFDRMGTGSAPEGHFSHFAKNRLQWMPDSKVEEPTADGTFRIYRFDHANALANPTLAVKVPMGGDVFYWVGYRQLYTSPSYNLETGAYIVAEGLSQGAETNLIDATPGSATPESADRADCGLEVGTPFVDSGVTFTAVLRGGTDPNQWIDVNITFAGRVGLVATNVGVDEQLGTAWLTLQRQFNSSGIASVDFATSDVSATASADYYATSGTVTWADGDSADKTIAIPIRPDAAVEGTESFTVTLSNPTGTSLDAVANTATVSILDPGERCTTFSPAFFNSTVHAIVPLDNGQVLMGGRIQDGGGDLASVMHLARLNPDGSNDATLATGTGFNDRVRALAVQADGKIIAGGDFTSYNGTACAGLIRLNPNGSIDTNIGGVDNGTVYSIAVEIDGKILVGGSFSSFDSTPVEGMIRLTAAGARDTVNALTLPFVTSWNSSVYSITVESDGKIMAAGGFYIGGVGGFKSGVARLNSDGTRDTSFDPGDGAHTQGATGNRRAVYALQREPDGKYIIGGFLTGYDGNNVPYLARINNNGSFDSSFTPPAFNASVRTLQLQPNGKVVVGGSFTAGGGHLARLNSDGTNDSTFDVGAGTDGTVYALAQIDSGMLYVGGNYFTFAGASSRPITKIAGGVSPYDFWKADNFSVAQIAGGDADPGADPDGDGTSNAAERALGTDPNVANADPVFGPGSPTAAILHESGGNSYLQITVDKSAFSSGAWFVAQLTSDLQTWSPAPSLPGTNAVYDILEDSPTRFVIRDKTPIGTGDRFVKIGVTNPN